MCYGITKQHGAAMPHYGEIMTEFTAGVLASAAVLSALCAMMYWIFNLVEKRLELKVDLIGNDVGRIANELREERKSKDHLYKFVMDYVHKTESK